MLSDRPSLPQYFASQGYRTFATGKIFHQQTVAGGDAKHPEFEVAGRFGGVGSSPKHKLVGPTPMNDNKLVDWGVWPPDNDDTKKGDHQVASWVERQIRDAPDDKPFFISAGFFLPHVPCYATQKWFDLYPDDDCVLPVILENDREDVPRFAWYLNWRLSSPRLKWLRENNQWRNLVRSYLASTSFMDAQVGRLSEPWRKPAAARTPSLSSGATTAGTSAKKPSVEKTRSGSVPPASRSSSRVPASRKASVSLRPPNFSTSSLLFIELTGVPGNPDLEGISLVPQLRDAAAKRERPAITTNNPGNHAVRSENWRYIRYADGSEELYDMRTDPREWHNLAAKPEHAAVIAEHNKWLPAKDSPHAPGSATRILTYDLATDTAVWEGETVTRKDPIPE